jgi:hypothetical protein
MNKPGFIEIHPLQKRSKIMSMIEVERKRKWLDMNN